MGSRIVLGSLFSVNTDVFMHSLMALPISLRTKRVFERERVYLPFIGPSMTGDIRQDKALRTWRYSKRGRLCRSFTLDGTRAMKLFHATSISMASSAHIARSKVPSRSPVRKQDSPPPPMPPWHYAFEGASHIIRRYTTSPSTPTGISRRSCRRDM